MENPEKRSRITFDYDREKFKKLNKMIPHGQRQVIMEKVTDHIIRLLENIPGSPNRKALVLVSFLERDTSLGELVNISTDLEEKGR